MNHQIFPSSKLKLLHHNSKTLSSTFQLESKNPVKPPKVCPFNVVIFHIGPHTKAVPRKLEILAFSSAFSHTPQASCYPVPNGA